MHPTGRQLYNVLAMISVLLCLAIVIVWTRGYFTNDEIHINIRSHLMIAGSFPNHVDFLCYRAANYHGSLFTLYPHAKHIVPKPQYWLFRLRANNASVEVSVPWWIALVMGLALPAGAASRAYGRRRLMQLGCCVHCGYDLRASPERCPECGAKK